MFGGIRPIFGGDMGVLNLAFFGFLAYFGLLFLGTLSTDFRFFDGVRQIRGPPNNRGNFTKVKFVKFEQCGSKVGVGHFWCTFGVYPLWRFVPPI